MPWGAVAAAVIGGAASADASRSAGNKQKDAADAATQLNRDIYNDTTQRNEPFVTGGTSSYNELLRRLGISGNATSEGYGSLGKVPTSADVMATPGYQFGLDQGQNSLNKQLNARGLSYSGAALKAANRYGTDYATTKYDNAFGNLQSANQQSYNQLMGAAGLGQASANNTASAGQQFGTQAGNNMIGAGNAQAASGIAQSNAWQNALNQGVSAYKSSGSWGGNSSVGSGGYSTGLEGQSPQQLDGYFAEGGPVRSEPVIGSRSPVRSSGSGPMSREAIIAALTTPPQGRSGVGALPANPATNPRAIIDAQAREAGAYSYGGPVQGPGGPRDDAIPAHLSDGEHVMDAATVTAIGRGSNERGQNMLNRFRARVKGH